MSHRVTRHARLMATTLQWRNLPHGRMPFWRAKALIEAMRQSDAALRKVGRA